MLISGKELRILISCTESWGGESGKEKVVKMGGRDGCPPAVGYFVYAET